jgi:hypothetical protein
MNSSPNPIEQSFELAAPLVIGSMLTLTIEAILARKRR